MKKLTLIATIAGIFTLQNNSQAQGLYAGVGIGYGFPSQAQAFYPTTTSSGTSTTFTSKSASYGAGLSAGIYGGYMVTNNFGLELGIADKFSASLSTTEQTSSTSTNGGVTTTNNDNDTYTAKGGILRFTPGIRLVAGNGNLKTYMVTGLIIGIPTATNEDAGTDNTISTAGGTTLSNTTNTSDEVLTYSGGIVIGFHGAVGVIYSLSDNIGIFGEISGNFQNWAPTEQLVTTATENGVDELGQLTTSQKQTNYVNSYTVNYATSTPGSPTQAARIYMPFSSWGITIGVHFNFGGGSSAATPAATPAAK